MCRTALNVNRQVGETTRLGSEREPHRYFDLATIAATLACCERKRLIEQKVPLLVPGNQLYLPDLGIDLREYFRKPPTAPDTARSPATQAGIETLPEPLPGACEWELWHDNPALIPNSDTVDPLSLTLSLQGNTDERVQLALDELKGCFPW